MTTAKEDGSRSARKARCVLTADRVESSARRLHEGFPCSGVGFSQDSLQLGRPLLSGEVRRAGRRESSVAPVLSISSLTPCSWYEEVVHHDDLPTLQVPSEEVFDVALGRLAIDGSLHAHAPAHDLVRPCSQVPAVR
jgi:hypothetical protein